MSFPINNLPMPDFFVTRPDVEPKPITPPSAPKPADGPGFSDLIGQALEKVNSVQAQADTSVQKFMTGETTEIHQVMLEMEQARLSMMMAVEVRNKTVEAYQEISRMPL